MFAHDVAFCLCVSESHIPGMLGKHQTLDSNIGEQFFNGGDVTRFEARWKERLVHRRSFLVFRHGGGWMHWYYAFEVRRCREAFGEVVECMRSKKRGVEMPIERGEFLIASTSRSAMTRWQSSTMEPTPDAFAFFKVHRCSAESSLESSVINYLRF